MVMINPFAPGDFAEKRVFHEASIQSSGFLVTVVL